MKKRFLKKIGINTVAAIFVAAIASSLFIGGVTEAAPTITITSPTSGQILENGSFTVTGTATADTLVELYQGSAFLGASNSDGSGNWSLAVTGLSNGTATLSAKAIETTQYAYFGAAGGSNTLNRIDLTNGNFTLNAGSTFPYDLGGTTYLGTTGTAPNGSLSYILQLGNGNAVPAQIDVDSPAVPDEITNYQVSPGTNGGAFSPDGATYYGANTGSDNVSIVDVASNEQTATISGLPDAQGARVSEDGARLFISYTGAGSPTTNDIAVFDTNTLNKVADIEIDCATTESVGYLLTKGQFLYVVCAKDATVKKVDIAANTVIETYDLSGSQSAIGAIQITPDGKTMYAGGAYPNSTSITAFDIESNSLISNINLTAAAFAGLLSPDGKYVLAATQGPFDGSVTNIDVISTATNTVVENIDTSSVGIPGIVFFGGTQSAVTTVSFVIGQDAADNNGDSLADTGQAKTLGVAVALLLIVSGALVMRRQYV